MCPRDGLASHRGGGGEELLLVVAETGGKDWSWGPHNMATTTHMF